MKLRIEGCTAEELAEYSAYLSLGKVYEAKEGSLFFTILSDDGHEVYDFMYEPLHLPEGARWVEV